MPASARRRAALSFLMPSPRLPAGVERQLYGILERSLNPAFAGEANVRDALAQAQEEADRTLVPKLME